MIFQEPSRIAKGQFLMQKISFRILPGEGKISKVVRRFEHFINYRVKGCYALILYCQFNQTDNKIFFKKVIWFLFYYFIFFNLYLFLTERERQTDRQSTRRGRGRERDTHRIWRRLQAQSCQHRAQHRGANSQTGR